MLGLSILGFFFIAIVLYATITWDDSFDASTKVLGIFYLLLFVFVVVVPTIYKLVVIRPKVKKRKLTDAEGYKKMCKIFTEGITAWTYFATLDDWFFKNHDKDIKDFLDSRK